MRSTWPLRNNLKTFSKMLLRRLTVIIARSRQFCSKSRLLRPVTMQDGFVEVNSVPSHVYTWGQWIEDKFDPKTKDLVLIVTGNPGLPGFYTKFGTTLHDELDKEVPVWVIGQAGHDEPKKDLAMRTPPLNGNEHLYDLEGQLKHKIEFIDRFIPRDVNVYLIGHSVGAKLCLDLLRHHKEFSNQVQHAYLMFPTIEKIAQSEKGVKVPTWDRYFFFLRAFYNMFHMIPSSWKRAIIRWQIGKQGVSEEFLPASLEYTNPRVIDRIWFLCLDEMKVIVDLDEETVKDNMHRLKLYYGAKDHWVKTEFYHDLVARFPGIDAELCKNGYEHAFCLNASQEVGKMVSEWINQKRQVQS